MTLGDGFPALGNNYVLSLIQSLYDHFRFFPVAQFMKFSHITSKCLRIFLLVWLMGLGCGFFLLGSYHARAGRPGEPSARWPEGSLICLGPDRPTLLIFLHPRCPCSRASLAELASIAASYRDRFAAHAILYRPYVPPEDWDRAEAAATDAASIPGLRRWKDPGGRLGRLFGVETSGHVLLFDPAGGLLFGGGITPSRGHRGGIPASRPWSQASSGGKPGRGRARSSVARSSNRHRHPGRR